MISTAMIIVGTVLTIANTKFNTGLADRKTQHQQDIQMLQDRCYKNQNGPANCKPLDDYLEKIK